MLLRIRFQVLLEFHNKRLKKVVLKCLASRNFLIELHPKPLNSGEALLRAYWVCTLVIANAETLETYVKVLVPIVMRTEQSWLESYSVGTLPQVAEATMPVGTHNFKQH
jgi:hypothetical protein